MSRARAPPPPTPQRKQAAVTLSETLAQPRLQRVSPFNVDYHSVDPRVMEMYETQAPGQITLQDQSMNSHVNKLEDELEQVQEAVEVSMASKEAVQDKIQRLKTELAEAESEEKLHDDNTKRGNRRAEKIKAELKGNYKHQKALAYFRSNTKKKKYAQQALSMTREENHLLYIEDAMELQYEPSLMTLYKLVNHGANDNEENGDDEDVRTQKATKEEHAGRIISLLKITEHRPAANAAHASHASNNATDVFEEGALDGQSDEELQKMLLLVQQKLKARKTKIRRDEEEDSPKKKRARRDNF